MVYFILRININFVKKVFQLKDNTSQINEFKEELLKLSGVGKIIDKKYHPHITNKLISSGLNNIDSSFLNFYKINADVLREKETLKIANKWSADYTKYSYVILNEYHFNFNVNSVSSKLPMLKHSEIFDISFSRNVLYCFFSLSLCSFIRYFAF